MRAGKPGSALERLNGHVAVGAEYKRTKHNGDFVAEETLIREEAGFRARGRLLDSRFLRYDLGLVLAFNQTNSSEDDSDLKNLFLPSYYGNLSFLEKHPTPITVFGRRDEDRFIQESQFTTQLVETIVNEFGGRIGWNSNTLNASFDLERSLFDTSGLESGDRSVRRNVARFNLDHNPSAHFTTRLAYSFNTYDEAFSGQDYDTQTLNLVNNIRVGMQNNESGILFQTTFFSQDRTGTTEFTNVDFTENVLWMIDPYVFHSVTIYTHRYFESTSRSRLNAIEQSFRHWLYRSLESRVRANYGDEDINNGRVRRAGAGLDLRYRKQIEESSLQVTAVVDFGRQENDLEDGFQQVFDEPHTLSVTNVALLDSPNVIESSVVVTDASGAVVYTEGLDYSLIPRGDRTEITRIPGGLILEGQTVSVDYQYRTPKGLTFDREQSDLSAEFFGKTFRVFARVGRLRQTPVEGDATDEFLENRDSQTIGAAYYNDMGARLGAEFTNVDSNFSPFQQTRLTAGYNFGFGRKNRLGIGASYIHSDLPDDEVQQTTVVSLDLDSRPVDHLTIRFEPSYRIERGRAPGLDRNVINAFGEVRYDFGKFAIRWFIRHQSLDLETGDTGSTFTSITLARRW